MTTKSPFSQWGLIEAQDQTYTTYYSYKTLEHRQGEMLVESSCSRKQTRRRKAGTLLHGWETAGLSPGRDSFHPSREACYQVPRLEFDKKAILMTKLGQIQ